LIGDFAANPLNFSELSPFRGQDVLRFFENLQELAQPHRPDGRQHVERDARFDGVHEIL